MSEQTPRQILTETRKKKDPKYEIDSRYDPAKFENLTYDAKFVNQGEENYKKARAIWRQQIPNGDDDEDDDEDREDIFGDESQVDIDLTIQHLRQYKPFAEPIDLRSMAELLECIWLEAPTL